MDATMYSLKYEKEKAANAEIYKFTWTFYDFLNKSEEIREYRTKRFKLCRPQLRLQILGHDPTKSLIEVSFMFPSSVIMSAYVTSDRNISENLSLQFVEANKWNHLISIYNSDLINNLKRNNPNPGMMFGNQYSTNTDFTLQFTFTVQKLFNEKTFRENIANSLYLNFEGIWKSGDLSDVVIKSKDGKEYKVHKFMLMARSRVLRAHFDHDTKESQTNIIEVSLNSDVLEEVLSYLYTDKVPRIKELGKEILAAADYYEIHGLKTLCVEELGKKLPEEITNQMKELADSCQATNLKEAATKFLKKMEFFAGHMEDNDWQVVTCTPDTD